VYSHPKLVLRPDRNYKAKVVQVKPWGRPARWELRANGGKSRRKFCRLPAIGNPNAVTYDQDEALAICQKLVDALNRWPDEDAISGTVLSSRPKPTTKVLIDAAHVSALPAKPLERPWPTFGKQDLNLSIRVWHLDPETLESVVTTVIVAARGIHRDAPDPGNIVFYTSELNGSALGASSYRTAGVDIADQEKLIRCERFIRYFHGVWSRRSLVCTKDEARSFAKAHMAKFQDSTCRTRGEYDGGSVFRHFRRLESHNIRLKPGQPVKNSIAGTLPWPKINSVDVSWVKPLYDMALSRWTETGDILDTWMLLAKAADEINARILAGEHSPNFCDRAGECTLDHPCSVCGMDTPCNSLTTYWDEDRACPICITRENCYFTPKRLESILLRQIRLQWSVERRKSRQADAVNRDDEQIEVMRQRVCGLLTGAHGPNYRCTYSGQYVRHGRVIYEPHNASVDAIFPFTLDNKGKTVIHWADNIALVPIALNLGKHMQLPIFLQTLSDYFRACQRLVNGVQTGNDRAVEELRQLEEHMVTDCRRLAIVRNRVPKSKFKRLGLTVSTAQLRYYREEWVSGRLHPGMPFSPSAMLPRVPNTLHWSVEDRRRISRLVQEIQCWTGIRLIARSGCPYFGHPTTMPENWGWLMASGIMCDRYYRMKNACNAKHATVDSPETLFLECVFQCCVRLMGIATNDPEAGRKKTLQGKYAEFLGLPFTVELRNPLTFAIAHRVCGSSCYGCGDVITF